MGFAGKNILITGGTGSLGSALVNRLLKTQASRIVVYDINQSGLHKMEHEYTDSRIRYFVGDVRDFKRLKRAMEGCNIVIHTAAYKIIPSCEYNPFEAVKTNILGSQNIVEATLETETVQKVVGISSDKACSPLNLYGATKICMERIFVASNYYKGRREACFFCTRYGNVLGSADSVIPIWKKQLAEGKPLTLTKGDMTRFNVTMQQGIDFIFRSLQTARGAEVFAPKLKAYYVKDLLNAFIEVMGSNPSIQEIPIRPGEKLHEVIINKYEMRTAVTFGPFQDYAILPDESTIKRFNLRFYFDDPVKFPEPVVYSSKNAEKHTKEELKEMLRKEVNQFNFEVEVGQCS